MIDAVLERVQAVPEWALLIGVGLVSLAAPFVMPSLVTQLAFLWLMVVFSQTWDVLGGQLGYNSFGNVIFFGIGCYTSAVLQRDSGLPYYDALALGIAAAGIVALVAALVFGAALLGIRGHYFAIATLGLGIAAGEIASGWDYVGAGSGMAMQLFPGGLGSRELFFYFVMFAIAALCFFTLRWLYGTRFGLAMNAIRDDEDKAEAMGLRTTSIKTLAWAISAFFLGISGAVAGNMLGFIDPRDVAFSGATFGVWMVLMAILGGKGTLWGPVIGAVIFHITKEFFWTYLLGWQRVALGLLIVVIVLFFPQGIMGWARARLQARAGAAQ